MSSSTVSVAIMTFNRPALLREALRSVQTQTRKPDEVFISDNSTNPDHGLAGEFPDLPIRYHFHSSRLSIDEHWTWCISQPSTDFIAVLEDDNLFRPRHVEVLSGGLDAHPEAVLAGSSTLPFSDRVKRLPPQVFAPAWPCDLLSQEPLLVSRDIALATYLFGSPFASSAIMFRRSALPQEGFQRTGLRISHDRWMWTQVIAAGPVLFCPEITMLYRDHAIQVVKNFKRHVHREDSRICTSLIWDLMQRRGIQIGDAVSAMAGMLSLHSRKEFSYLFVRGRDWKRWNIIRPCLLPEYSLLQACSAAIISFLKLRLKAVLHLGP